MTTAYQICLLQLAAIVAAAYLCSGADLGGARGVSYEPPFSTYKLILTALQFLNFQSHRSTESKIAATVFATPTPTLHFELYMHESALIFCTDN